MKYSNEPKVLSLNQSRNSFFFFDVWYELCIDKFSSESRVSGTLLHQIHHFHQLWLIANQGLIKAVETLRPQPAGSFGSFLISLWGNEPPSLLIYSLSKLVPNDFMVLISSFKSSSHFCTISIFIFYGNFDRNGHKTTQKDRKKLTPK